MDAILDELQKASPRSLTNQEIYNLPAVKNKFRNPNATNKSKSGSVNKGIERINDKQRKKDNRIWIVG